ncbi:DinB family protein [Actinomycetospora aeridis]|uniref:DinB family protein n=1 Tax=Actinomycetospora aeridis TaxID=3129231 RepID=A0ABU8N564_9PSEU
MTTIAAQETPMTTTDADERADLLAELAQARHWLVFPTRDLTDEQAGSQPTASQLTLGGLIKHVAKVEEGWMRFAVEGDNGEEGFELPEGMTLDDFEGWIASLDEKPEWLVERENEFKLLPDETLAGVIAQYHEVAARTEQTLASLPDLNLRHELPKAPWHEPGTSWSVRRVMLHIIAETTQHAGHADMLREHIDGATSM